MNFPPVLEYEHIAQILPHRYPFLLVDRILSYELNNKIIGIKNVTINEPFFQGHFPGRPIMPGVLIIEAMAQVGGILGYLSTPEELGNPTIFLLGLDQVRFRKLVVPGDQLVIEAETVQRRKNFWRMQGRALVNQTLVAEAQMMAAISREDNKNG